ncbi:MAG: hypothetical protein Q7J44_10165 [Pseudotabrizicola sp.]|uniref:hypothetical protein n=1 Tax=Pseudotabrizicola sp. TaxID=2939647 RepID=UPI002719F989|nr:hypothetical protein [Pseudotabrizicola sp.]MDO9638896.1 hypothetical protein [Pseudotabrizicola sp.]
MRLPLILFAILTPALAATETFQRPIPQPQTAEAELAYLAASLIFLAALVAVQWLVSRR